jgi:hypothetical protein
MHIKVINDKSLVRDTTSNAILETDLEKLHKHRAMQAAIAEKADKEKVIDNLVDRINKLESLIERMTNGNNNL